MPSADKVIEEVEEDEDYEDDDEDYEEEEEEEADGEIEDADEDEAPKPAAGASTIAGVAPLKPRAGDIKPAGDAKAWQGLAQMPAATQAALKASLDKLVAKGKSQVTILLLGKSGMGKSSTCNSLFNERCVLTSALSFDSSTAKPVMVSREAAGFTFSVIDTPGLLDGDSVDIGAVKMIQSFIKDKAVDAVLYVDRLDAYRVSSADKNVIDAVTANFGPAVWKMTTLALSHGMLTNQGQPPDGKSYGDFTAARVAGLVDAMKKSCGSKDLQVPVALVENSGRCATNAAGEKTLPDGTVWVSSLVAKVVDQVAAGPPKGAQARMSKMKKESRGGKKLLIPFFLAAQWAIKKYWIDPAIDEDGVTGDQYGPFSPEEVERLRRRKKRAAKKKEAEAKKAELEKRRKEWGSAAGPSAPAAAAPAAAPAAPAAPAAAPAS